MPYILNIPFRMTFLFDSYYILVGSLTVVLRTDLTKKCIWKHTIDSVRRNY